MSDAATVRRLERERARKKKARAKKAEARRLVVVAATAGGVGREVREAHAERMANLASKSPAKPRGVPRRA